jgi:hypothetical protein
VGHQFDGTGVPATRHWKPIGAKLNTDAELG